MVYTEIEKPPVPTATEIERPTNSRPRTINDLSDLAETINDLSSVASTIDGLSGAICIYHEIEKPVLA